MSAPLRAGRPEITHGRASAQVARDRSEARNWIDGCRAGIADGIKAVWRAYAAGEIDDAEAEHRDRLLRDQLPSPYDPVRRPSAPSPHRPPRRPDLIERRRHVRKLAFSGPMPPKLAVRFTPSQLAVLNIIGDEVLKTGTCRLSVKELADRARTCRRTVQNAVRLARLCALLVVKCRRLTRTMSLPNIVTITSKEWLVWLARRGAWEPSPRTGQIYSAEEVSNKGAKRCLPQVLYIKKERGGPEEHRGDHANNPTSASYQASLDRWRRALGTLRAYNAKDEAAEENDDYRFSRATVINPKAGPP